MYQRRTIKQLPKGTILISSVFLSDDGEVWKTVLDISNFFFLRFNLSVGGDMWVRPLVHKWEN